MLIEQERLDPSSAHQHIHAQKVKISVCVRKRPIFTKEESGGEIDAVSAANPIVRVHECKFKIDGITKTVENHDFVFDNAFSHGESTDSLYVATLKPVMPLAFQRNGVVTCFAYG